MTSGCHVNRCRESEVMVARSLETGMKVRRALVVAIVAMVLVSCSKEPAQTKRPPPEVTVITVTPRDVPFAPTFVAQTESSQLVDIVARVSGFLDRIAYDEGKLVKKGQLLFQIDSKPFEAQLDAAKGELAAQKARLTTARANLNRVKPLVEQDALPRADLDKATGDFESATAAVYAAEAKVKEAKLNLGYTAIRSPLTGLAGRALQRQGAYINSTAESAKLTYVAAIDPIWVTFSVSQNQVAKWRELMATGAVVAPPNQNFDIDIIMSDGKPYPFKGKINFADPSFSQDTASFMVRAVVANPKHDLMPGMFVTAIMSGATRPNAVVIPQLAVQQGANGHLVYVVKPDGTAEVRPVAVGDYVGDKDIVVMSGLHAGDRVVVDGVLKVVAGQPVKIHEPTAPAAAAPASPTPEPAKD
jgi:membrane fusion protein (multidrug efflux system)